MKRLKELREWRTKYCVFVQQLGKLQRAMEWRGFQDAQQREHSLLEADREEMLWLLINTLYDSILLLEPMLDYTLIS